MNVGSLGLAGTVAGTQLAQAKGSDIDKAKADATHQQRHTDSALKADAAAGIGTTQGDTETSDRDGDGRRVWELDGEKKADTPAQGELPGAPPLSKDPTGSSGQQLDLCG